MQPAFYRIQQLATTKTRSGLLPLSAPTIWRFVRTGQFPKPVKLGENTSAWPAESVHQWIEAKKKGAMN